MTFPAEGMWGWCFRISLDLPRSPSAFYSPLPKPPPETLYIVGMSSTMRRKSLSTTSSLSCTSRTQPASERMSIVFFTCPDPPFFGSA